MLSLLTRRTKIRNIYRTLNQKFSRPVENGYLPKEDQLNLANVLSLPNDALDILSKRIIPVHLHIIHNARLKMVKCLLPAGDVILDLGGANAPLNKMEYPHPYSKIVLIDLPTEERHVDFQVQTDESDKKVFVHYGDMTNLSHFESNSVDLVWSGQSIEHVTEDQGKNMCKEAWRVLKPRGHYCLDTPNRLLTKLHTATVGGGFIHPEHKIEYTPAQLRQLLLDTGFSIQSEWGICEMPITVKSNSFSYADFILGGAISHNIDDSYIQFFHAQKC